jgi:signal transduction histidine kinase
VVEDFLRLARPIQVEQETCDLLAELGEVVTLASAEAKARGVALAVQQAQLPVVRGDCKKLRQVFLNLVLNGLQAVPRGGSLNISATFTGSQEAVSPFVELAFTDTGEGIEPAVLKRIFEPFFTTKPGGTGLGLAITQRIVESHGGSIEVESKVGRGTTFKVRLPV